MSWSDRRWVLFGLGSLALTACGFQPAYREASGPGGIFLPEATDPESFAYRERLRRRLQGVGRDGFRLESRLSFDEIGQAITQASDITRFRLKGEARWALIDPEGRLADEGIVRSETGYDATAGVFATRQAEEAARHRLSIDLAELTAVRVLATLAS